MKVYNPSEATETDPALRRRQAQLFQWLGLVDVALGLGAVFALPAVLDIDDFLARMIGGAVALGGVAVWAIGQFGFGGATDEPRVTPTVKRMH